MKVVPKEIYQEEDEEEAVKENGNQGVGDFRFINILQLFSIYSFFFSYFTLSLFFYTFFYPRHLPTPTTDDFYPLPTTFNYARSAFDTSPQNIAPCSNV